MTDGRCGRCNGAMIPDDSDNVCLNCGRREYDVRGSVLPLRNPNLPMVTEPTPRSGYITQRTPGGGRSRHTRGGPASG